MATMPVVHGDFSNGSLHYSTPGVYTLSSNVISYVPIDWTAADIVLRNSIHSTTDISLNATRQLLFQNANITIAGSGIFKSAGDIQFNESAVIAHDRLLVDAQGRARNYASNLWAQNDIYVDGAAGIESIAKVNRIVTEHTHWKWHGLRSGYETTTDVQTVITPSSIISAQGQLKLNALHGSILSQATDFGKSVEFSAKGPVMLYDARSQNAHYSDMYGLFGYHAEAEMHDISVPSQILSQTNVHINTPGDILGQGTIVHAKDVLFNGNVVKFEKPILNHSYSTLDIGILGVNVPAITQSVDVLQFFPLLKSAFQVSHARNDLEKLTSSVNLSIDMVNELNSFITTLKESVNNMQGTAWYNTILKQKLMGMISQLFRVDVSIGVRNTSLTYQTLGTGEILANTLTVIAEKIGFTNAYDVKVKTAALNTSEVEFSGATLRTSDRSTTHNVTLGIDIFTKLSGSAGYQHSSIDQMTHVMSRPEIEQLALQTDVLNLRSAGLTTNLSGTVGTVNIVSERDSISYSNQTAEFGSEGQLGYSQQSESRETLPQISSLNNTSNTALQTEINNLNLTGANSNLTQAQHVTSRTLPLDNSEHHFAFSTNIPITIQI